MRLTNELINRIKLIQSKINNTVTIYKEAENTIDNYNYIKDIALIYRNTKEIIKTYKKFEETNKIFQRVEELFKKPEQNLLLLCFYISKLNMFKDECEKGKEDNTEKKVSLGIYFEKLDLINKKEKSVLINIIDHFLFYAEKEMTYVIVWLSKIAESRKNLEFVFSRMCSVIESKFSIQEKEINEKLKEIDFWKKEMLLIKTKVSPCFRNSSDVLIRLIQKYHLCVYNTINQTELKTISAPSILFLFSWIEDYYKELKEQIGIERKKIQPDLIQKQEENLFKRYVLLCSEKITKWISTLARNERKHFIEMKDLPEKNEKDLYLSPSAVDLFQVIKQHTEAVKITRNKKLSQAILFKCLESISVFQKEIISAIEEETNKYVLILANEKETIPPYFEEYILMFGNTCLCWIEYMTVIEEQNEDCTENEKLKLDQCNNGFLEIAKKVNSSLICVMRTTLLPAFKILFTEEWLKSNIMERIIATVSDYFQAYKSNYHPFLLLDLMKESIFEVTIDYLMALKMNIFKVKDTTEFFNLFDKDTKKLISFYISITQQKELLLEVSEIFSSLGKVLFQSTTSTLLSFLFPLFQKHGDVSTDFLSNILLKRKDMKKADVLSSIAEIKKRKKNGEYKKEISFVFSKLK